jgi:hypothetical protein
MALIADDTEDIQAMLNDGESNREIAKHYNVNEITVRRFIADNNLVKPNKRNNVAAVSHNVAHSRNSNYATNSPFLPLSGEYVPMPQINDVGLLQYMLQLKESEARRAKMELAELEAKHKKLLEENTIHEINKTRFEVEKENAIKDALAGKGGMAEMGMKALEMVSQNEVLSGALAGIITKFTNASPSAPLLGTGNDTMMNDFMASLNAQPENIRKQLIAACYTLIAQPQMLNNIIKPII